MPQLTHAIIILITTLGATVRGTNPNVRMDILNYCLRMPKAETEQLFFSWVEDIHNRYFPSREAVLNQIIYNTISA